MRCSSSRPVIVIAVLPNPLKPSITAMRCFTPRWSYEPRDERVFCILADLIGHVVKPPADDDE